MKRLIHWFKAGEQNFWSPGRRGDYVL